jgi:hypothetical protein
MTIWFLMVLSCLSPDNQTTCHNAGPPIMTFVQHDECRAVVLTSLRLAALARKRVGYACERGFAL